MFGLVDNRGQIRASSVGIAKGDEIAYIALLAHFLKYQLKEFLKFVKNETDLLLIRSYIFHYEFEFIHLF